MCPRIACLLGVFALSTACKSTPLDVVWAADLAGAASRGGAGAGGGAQGGGAAGIGGAAGSGGGAGGSGGAEANGGAGAGGEAATGDGAGAGGEAPDAGPCSMVGAGLYVLRSRANGLCLGQGAPTTVFGSPGFLLNFAADCRLPARTWQLTSTATPNVFSIQNSSSGYVLDVQTAGTWDGTPVITFGETGFDNQRFEVRPRDTFASELRPQHHPQSCVSASPNGAQITTCEPTDSTQAWLLQRSDCL